MRSLRQRHDPPDGADPAPVDRDARMRRTAEPLAAGEQHTAPRWAPAPPMPAPGGGSGSGDLGALAGILRRRLWIVVLAVVATAGAAFAVASLQEDEYESTSTLLFRPLMLDVQLSGVPLQVPGDADRDAETNRRVVSLRAIRERAAARLGGRIDASTLEKRLTIAAEGESNLVTITATGTTARRAKRIADVMAAETVAFRRELVQRELAKAEGELAREFRRSSSPARRRQISRQRQQLRTLRAVQTGDVQRVETGELPTEPSAPKPLRGAVLGGFVGLLIGLGLAIAVEQLDRRLRRPAQLVEAAGLPLLASVPRSARLRKGDGWKAGLPEAEAEAFRMLRANLRHSGGFAGGLRSVMVTSAGPDAGKTTVALHLAAAAAAAGQRVLLIEADLRRPKLAKLLGSAATGKDTGLVAALQGAGLDAAVQVKAHGGATFDALTAGTSGSAGGGELLDSPAMEELLGRAAASYDLVIVDGPPPALVADAIGLLVQVDGVVLVGRLGKDARAQVVALRRELDQLEARAVGVVATFARKGGGGYATAA